MNDKPALIFIDGEVFGAPDRHQRVTPADRIRNKVRSSVAASVDARERLERIHARGEHRLLEAARAISAKAGDALAEGDRWEDEPWNFTEEQIDAMARAGCAGPEVSGHARRPD